MFPTIKKPGSKKGMIQTIQNGDNTISQDSVGMADRIWSIVNCLVSTTAVEQSVVQSYGVELLIYRFRKI